MFRPFTGDLKIDDPIGLCLPYGFTSQIFVPYAQQWIQAPNYLVIGGTIGKGPTAQLILLTFDKMAIHKLFSELHTFEL
jgi:hypothetical protein